MLAEHIMSSDIVSIQLGATVRDAVALFQESTLHDFPVIDAAGKPVGIVTARSILHFAVPAYASDDLPALMRSGPDIDSLYRNLAAELGRPVRDVLERSFDVVKATIPASAVAAMLTHLKGDTNNILVVDDAGKLIGIISARDIICRLPEQIQE